MRYWIWWNDLIQGPFELEELTSLKTFSEDLLVCMEDRQEWIPAGRVADLSAAVEQLRARQAAPRVPPPPPPKRPPTVTPLQGEFFADPPGQETFLESDDEPKGPFAYRPVASDSDLPPWTHLRGEATMPFHFMSQPKDMNRATSVIELPQPQSIPQRQRIPDPLPQPRPQRVTMSPPPVIRESAVPKLEDESPIPLSVLDTAPSVLDDAYSDEQKPQWLIWIICVIVTLGVLGSVAYWFVDHASSRAAISEANRIEPGRPLVIPEAKFPAAQPAQGSPAPASASSPLSSAVDQYVAQKSRNAAIAAARRKKSVGMSRIVAAPESAAAQAAATDATHAAKSEVGTAVGSTSVLSSLSSAVRQMFSRWGSARPRSDGQTTSEAPVATNNLATQPLHPSGVGTSEVTAAEAAASASLGVKSASRQNSSIGESSAASAAAVTGAAMGAESGVATIAGSPSAFSRRGSAPSSSETQAAAGGASQEASAAAATGAALGAKSGIGVTAGSASNFSSLSSVIHQIFSRWGSAQSDSEAQTTNSISSETSQAASGVVVPSAALSAKSGVGVAAGLASSFSSLSSAVRPIFSRSGSAQNALETNTTSSISSNENEISRTTPTGSMTSVPNTTPSQTSSASSSSMIKTSTLGNTRHQHKSSSYHKQSQHPKDANGLISSKRSSAQANAKAKASTDNLGGPSLPSTSNEESGESPRGSMADATNGAPGRTTLSNSDTAEKANGQALPSKGTGALQMAAASAATGATSAMPGETPSVGAMAGSASSSSSVGRRTSSKRSSTPGSGEAQTSAGSAAGTPNGAPIALPGIGASDEAIPGQSGAEAYTPLQAPKADPWKGKQNEAIMLVQNKTLPRSKITIGNQARAILQEMHEKELIHAAETGERLYLPDKMAWAALQEEGSIYRVYLNFLSWQASGERVQSRSYQLIVDLKTKQVHTEDAAAQQDLLGQPAELTFKHNPMATDIESILGGVDTYNKHKVQLIIVKKNNRNRDERTKIETALSAAQGKVIRAAAYFRKTYTEQALENVAKAYAFSELLKG